MNTIIWHNFTERRKRRSTKNNSFKSGTFFVSSFLFHPLTLLSFYVRQGERSEGRWFLREPGCGRKKKGRGRTWKLITTRIDLKKGKKKVKKKTTENNNLKQSYRESLESALYFRDWRTFERWFGNMESQNNGWTLAGNFHIGTFLVFSISDLGNHSSSKLWGQKTKIRKRWKFGIIKFHLRKNTNFFKWEERKSLLLGISWITDGKLILYVLMKLQAVPNWVQKGWGL